MLVATAHKNRISKRRTKNAIIAGTCFWRYTKMKKKQKNKEAHYYYVVRCMRMYVQN